MVVVAPAGRERPARRIIRQLPGLAAFGRNHVDLLVTVILAGEGDPTPCRIELREEFQPGMRGEANRTPALIRHAPDVARMDKDDAVPMDVWKA